MTDGFWGSKEFVIGAVVAGLVLALGAAMVSGDGVRSFAGSKGCDVDAPDGPRLEADVEDPGPRPGVDEVTRTATHTPRLQSWAGAVVAVCSPVGAVEVRPSAESVVRVTTVVVVDHRGADDAVRDTRVDVVFVDLGDRIGIAVDVPQLAHTRSFPFGRDSADVRVLVELPQTTIVEGDTWTDVGDVTVRGVQARDLRVATDVGDIVLEPSRFASGRIDASTDVGRITIRTPRSGDAGYDVTAVTDVGDVTLSLGPTELDQRGDDDPAGDDVHVRTAGYAARTVRVEAHLRTDVGDITFTTT